MYAGLLSRPFIAVVDVGHVIELYAEFSRSGGAYTPYPDVRTHRIRLDDLARPVTPKYLNTRAFTIFGGASEIQREIISRELID